MDPELSAAIVKKLRFRDETRVVIGLPEELAAVFSGPWYAYDFPQEGLSSQTLVFVRDRERFLSFLSNEFSKIAFDSMIWIAYPKGGLKIKTDIHRDILWEIGKQHGIDTVAAISIDATWTGLRFRPTERVGK